MSTPTSGPGPDDPAGPPPGQGGPPSYGQGSPGYGQQTPGQPEPGYGQPNPGYGPPAQGYGPPAAGYGPPAPGYGQGAPQGYGQPPSYPNAPAGYGEAPAQRPGQVTAAAIIGIVVGALNLLGLFSIGFAFSISVVTGIFTLIGVALGAAMLAGGIQVLRGGQPQLLLLAAYTSIALSLLSIVINVVQGYDFAVVGLISLIIPGLIIVFIRQNSAWFARTTH